jgi:DNA-binding winged helix-turn-helix (wHTH) protein/phosphohistidine phosphatase SixA
MTENSQIEHLSINFIDYSIKSNGVELNIDQKAVEVLKILIDNVGQTVTIDTFMQSVWKDKPSSNEVVTSAIARLRKLFKMTGNSNELITTVHKVGYRFNKPSESNNPKTNYAIVFALIAFLLLALITGFNYFSKHNHVSKLGLSQNKLSIVKKESLSNISQIYILRHTEKASLTEENPNLSEFGIKHANYWKRVLQFIKFDRVFTTDFLRNIETAEILSSDLSIKPEIYYPMSFDTVKFIKEIQGQKVLIIGHSNTIPDMVNRIIDETMYPPMSHKNYNLLYLITINENGNTSSSVLHIEMPITDYN